jgi:cation:H+ antiporter
MIFAPNCTLMNIWIQFGLCAAVILFAGNQLSRYGDVIADRTGLGKRWMGLVLLATITSLPELFTSVSAVTLHDLPDMAVSSTIGSCMFNMVIIGILDFLSKGKPLSLIVHEGQILSAGFGIVLMGFAAIDILFGKYLPIVAGANYSDPLSFVFILVYLIAMRIIFTYERSRFDQSVQVAASSEQKVSSLTKVIALFTLYAVVIVAAATYLPDLGEKIGKITGWGESFIGSSFIAIATSLPELAVSISAARRGSYDMAVASLLGSNLFNIVILAITDFCYHKAPLLRVVSVANTLSALTAIISMGIVIIALTYKAEKKFYFLAGDAAALILIYVLANVLLFMAR